MPLRGESHSGFVRDEAPYFKSLAELDKWFTRSHDKLSGVLPYQPRLFNGEWDNRGKLLVCHDYKGGYTETPSGLCYTFNFWRLCDTFIYFSHHQVTVPPSGWTNAAHKQGTKMLGTLIFEGSHVSNPETFHLVVGDSDYVVTSNEIPISKRYAVLLAELAYQRGFDGYLLNMESHLLHGTNHARALAAWSLLLREELQVKVGPHAEVIWYDSVIYNGFVSYQNRLNGYNLPFFLSSDTLFTNYWWTPQTQDSMVQYFENLKATPSAPTKTLQDVYSGIDVFGRHQYGGGGFYSYRAIKHTSSLGLSTAFFAPGWTWENATQNPEQNWNAWWANERTLWLGPLKPGDVIPVPPSPEGPFVPMTDFFQDLPPPDPSKFAFYTHFSPGVGYSWFVEGKKVMHSEKGWTDIDKQCSIGNLVWPWPTLSWHGVQQEEAVPIASPALDMTDGYNGGNTLKLTLTYAGSKSVGAVKTIWLPVQSLTVRTQESFESRVAFKTEAGNNVGVEPLFSVKSLYEDKEESTVFIPGKASISKLPNGWIQQIISFKTSPSIQDATSVAVLGFIVHIKSKVPSAKATFSLSLGHLAVYPAPPPQSVSLGTPSTTRARFGHRPNVIGGDLTWDTASTLHPVDIGSVVVDRESTTPAWLLKDTPAYRFPSFVYFNIYVGPLYRPPSEAVFLGTTGIGGHANTFHVEPPWLPPERPTWSDKGLRFYVQGVTDRGEVLPWDRCAHVDHLKGT